MSLNPKTVLFRVIHYVNSHVNDIVQQKLKNPLSYGSYGCDVCAWITEFGVPIEMYRSRAECQTFNDVFIPNPMLLMLWKSPLSRDCWWYLAKSWMNSPERRDLFQRKVIQWFRANGEKNNPKPDHHDQQQEQKGEKAQEGDTVISA